MVWRMPLAFVAGVFLYMIAMAMTVYDGALSLVVQPFVGALLTGVGLGVVVVGGSPLLITPVWKWWRRWWWVSVGVVFLSLVAMIASCVPTLRTHVLDPETGRMMESFQPGLAIGGWVGMLFGIVYCPMIGLRGDRRWL